MIGWYVRGLLLNRDIIRESLFSAHDSGDFTDGIATVSLNFDDDYELGVSENNFDSELYDDLLAVERSLDDLIRSGEIDESDLLVLNSILKYREIGKVMKEFNMGNTTVYSTLDRIFGKIADNLGGYFTDDGYIERLKCKHNLTDKQLLIIKRFIRKGKGFAQIE